MNQKLFKVTPLSMMVGAAVLCSSGAMALDVELGDTKVSAYGYVKLDAMYDVGDVKAGSKGLGNSIDFSRVAVGDEKTSSGGDTTFHAYQSRLGLKTVTPTGQGDLLTVLEGDFYGSGGGNFRLRHAYGSWNGLTAGQTWTNFGSLIGATPVLDFTGPIGPGGNRQAQLRYSSNGLHLALEAPSGSMSGTSFVDEANVADGDRKDSLPDLTLRYESAFGNLKYALGGLLREVALDDGEVDDSATGWGLFAAASLSLDQGTTFRAMIGGGDGIGGYLNVSGAPAAYRAGDSLETLTAWGGALGVSQPVGPGAVNLSYSYADIDWDHALQAGLAVGGRDKKRELVHLNYIWTPVNRVSYGLELSRASRTTADNDKGDALRLQASVTYSF
ncbi:DcaP family trimeric outer membrane transporter [Zobellella iuensis]|uniref:Porin n=1 Tax=Zobellella iuensis TaxID=2803811 RepID=A0ABS1QLW9_9GAMM|nr:DcaP family trimeric outer membrane transporter [Zobellella iuensis]MBL1375852.1 hypothetical protein [Zobellella iuensis]